MTARSIFAGDQRGNCHREDHLQNRLDLLFDIANNEENSPYDTTWWSMVASVFLYSPACPENIQPFLAVSIIVVVKATAKISA